MRKMEELKDFKCWVYILWCLNLTAVDSKANIKDRMIGYSALCSADPYPVIFVGEGKSKGVMNQIKHITDQKKAIE